MIRRTQAITVHAEDEMLACNGTVVMLHECAFVCRGLQALLEPRCRMIAVDRFEFLIELLPTLPSLDLLLLPAHSFPYSCRKSFNSFIRILFDMHPNCQVLLMIAKSEASYFFFLTRPCTQVGVFDLSLPVHTLTSQLSGILQGEMLPSLPYVMQALSYREYEVLSALLSGLSPKQIAWMLKLSEKTISHHKCRGLKKLGVRNLQTLLLGLDRTGLAGVLVPGGVSDVDYIE